jgi:hypothetical protein
VPALYDVVLLINIGEGLFVLILRPVLLKLTELILRIEEHRHDIGRIKVGLKVILIELPLTKIDTRLEVGRVCISRLLLRSFKVRKDLIHRRRDFI